MPFVLFYTSIILRYGKTKSWMTNTYLLCVCLSDCLSVSFPVPLAMDFELSDIEKAP